MMYVGKTASFFHVVMCALVPWRTLFVPRPSTRQLARALALGTLACAACAAPVLAATSGPTVRTNRGCYLVGQRVNVTGSGFATSRQYDVAIDGVDFGQSKTDTAGSFSATLGPGGLPAGQAQHVEHLNVTDGIISADSRFTLTRSAGARFLATSGNPHTLRAPFEIWGFSLDGTRRNVYLHYVSPAGAARRAIALGQSTGQCGYLRTGERRFFPFSPSLGTWTIQVDTRADYAKAPGGPVSRIRVQIR
jgi:hypothetical protein